MPKKILAANPQLEFAAVANFTHDEVCVCWNNIRF